MSLADLQRTMDESLKSANAFTRRLFEASSWDAERVQTFINQTGNITIATVRSSGKPHAALVIAGCDDGTIYFSVSRGSALLGNLRRQPEVAFTVGHSIMGRGPATDAGSASDVPELHLNVSRQLADLLSEPWDGYIWKVVPSRIFAS